MGWNQERCTDRQGITGINSRTFCFVRRWDVDVCCPPLMSLLSWKTSGDHECWPKAPVSMLSAVEGQASSASSASSSHPAIASKLTDNSRSEGRIRGGWRRALKDA